MIGELYRITERLFVWLKPNIFRMERLEVGETVTIVEIDEAKYRYCLLTSRGLWWCNSDDFYRGSERVT